MIQLANRKMNGDATTMKVTVKADVEQRCFQLKIHIFQSLLDNARVLFGTKDFKTAKEIAEALDLIFPAGVGGGIFYLWKYVWGNKPTAPETELRVENKGDVTIINYGDGAVITVPTSTYQLANDPEMITLGKKVMKPLEKPGYETLGFFSANDNLPVVEVAKDEALQFIEHAPSELPPPPPLEEGDEERTPIHAHVMVKTQRNEGKAQWELKWAARAEWASIDDLEWLEKFQAGLVPHSIPFYLDVEMTMITSLTNPNAPARFHVTRVINAIPGSTPSQPALL